ncbi:hypothetical protein GCK32_015089 [Trichostrongylus colubriformis]|uniref:DUF5641 domain-containing protein n=1 Tax=Trichostrongylus colubriformis TaxID=6319 RepID=A0AAN8F3E7_TRICO
MNLREFLANEVDLKSVLAEDACAKSDRQKKGINLTIPLNTDREIDGDTDYLPPEELRMLRTRIEVLDALKSSCETTDMFWKIWQEQYLTSLREKHKKTLTSQRHAQRIPAVGDVVLLCDPVLPRNSWRMARITGTRSGTDAAIREVELVTGTHRKIRRPVNLLIPLEIGSDLEDSEGSHSATRDDNESTERGPQNAPDSVEPRYNLRPRKTVNTVERKTDSNVVRKPRSYSSKWFLFHIMLLSLLIPTCTTTATNVRLTCAPSGALIHIPENQTIQVCAETLCTLHKTHTNPFLVKFPAHIILHDYVVTLKWEVGEQLAVMETTCARQNFCEQLDCWWCAATLFNPECRPVAAITIVAVMLYSSVALCYVLLIYALPKSEKIYEIFECVRWTEEIKLNMTIENAEDSKGTRSYMLSLIPNVPKKLPLLTITMTDVSLPPTPALSEEFITDGTDIAIWRNNLKPSLICSTAERALQMRCLFQDDCVCVGAENSARCTCSDHDLEEEFRQISNKLPVKTTAWEMSKRADNSVIAKISHMVSADFTVELNQTIDMSTQFVTSGRCHVANSEIEGCYHCSKGAQAKISCYSTNTVLGEILCNQQAFVVPCGPTSVQSTLLFHLDSAQQFINCSVRCGEELNYFTLTGILKYTHDFHETLRIMLEGNSTNFHEIKLPDFFHIAEVVGTRKTRMSSLMPTPRAQLLLKLRMQQLKIKGLQSQNQRLIEAFGELPQPRHLFDELLGVFGFLNETCRDVLRLDTNIDVLKRSQDHPYVKQLRIETLETQIENLRLRLYLTRTRLVVLHRQYDGLLATGKLSPATWEEFLEERYFDAEDQPIDLDPRQQEQLISDNLEFLGNYSTQLATIRRSMAEETSAQYYDDMRRVEEAVAADQRSFEDEILTGIRAIYGLLRKSLERPQEGNVSAKRPTIDHQERPEEASTLRNDRERNVDMRETEERTIKNNEGFIESLEIDDPQDRGEQQEEGLIVLDEVSDDEDEREIVVTVPNVSGDVLADPRTVTRQVAPASGRNTGQHAEVQHADDIANLEEQLKNTREKKLRAQQRVNELRRRKPTARRRFLPEKPQSGLPCVFCKAIGEHYSDACPKHRQAHARRRLVREDHRCEVCLLPLHQHNVCPRLGTPCRHCGRMDHHAALCGAPEQAEQIDKEIRKLNRRINEYKLRINRLTTSINQSGEPGSSRSYQK